MPTSHRRLTGFCLTVATAVTAGMLATSVLAVEPGARGVADGRVVAAPATAQPTPASPTPPTPPPASEPPLSLPQVEKPSAPELPALGAFLASGADGVRRIPELERWLSGTNLRVGHTYLPGDLWSNIEGRPAFLNAWAQWRRADADRMLVLNVPMLERNEAGVPDQEVRELLRAGADGAFDHHFRLLAERLVRMGVPETVIVLGWEMNGTTYTHRCGPDPQAWKAYWRRIVTTMRSVPGAWFRFDFTPNRGRDAIPWPQCYPGDDVVDIIGLDSYDQPPGEDFEDHINQPYGLRHHVEFAKAHGKPISYPEWGLFRNGDNPAYMRGMLAWFAEHKPLYQTITDYCPHGVWQCDENPRAAAVYRQALSDLAHVTDANSVAVTPAHPGAAATAEQDGCPPPRLGDPLQRSLTARRCQHPAV
ncbi:hypothetical protein JJV70_08710 [Streptomyces sp. JJ66]|uniref:glycoside hydrolase family 26 protein n=1 Tax=Streptomyces sp. JJ66 TaxID=2803843 RepID=UPI001C5719D4|nr:glycosyl hydrolase [Streptomyces sp. JJ66]MBW1602191.1 hypothetical protein [Streptomyces sp. JJ66]